MGSFPLVCSVMTLIFNTEKVPFLCTYSPRSGAEQILFYQTKPFAEKTKLIIVIKKRAFCDSYHKFNLALVVVSAPSAL